MTDVHVHRFATAVTPTSVAVAAALSCLALFALDPARSPLPTCPFRALTGLDCPGCGATRAAHHLLHGRIDVAFGYNALFVVVVPVIVAAWAVWAFPSLRRRQLPVRAAVVGWSALVVAVVFGVVRNVPWEPLSALGT